MMHNFVFSFLSCLNYLFIDMNRVLLRVLLGLLLIYKSQRWSARPWWVLYITRFIEVGWDGFRWHWHLINTWGMAPWIWGLICLKSLRSQRGVLSRLREKELLLLRHLLHVVDWRIIHSFHNITVEKFWGVQLLVVRSLLRSSGDNHWMGRIKLCKRELKRIFLDYLLPLCDSHGPLK